ncbi:hypothetical protein CERSUDRAFT_20322, partial [Gelatoporia subvermispora B]
ENARSMLTKIVNSLTARQEIGGPMLCAYLLGQPDHYTSHVFKPVFWYTYVREVDAAFGEASCNSITSQGDHEEDGSADTVVIGRGSRGKLVPLRKVDDYRLRPAAYEACSLYKYLSCTTIKKLSGDDTMRQSLARFLPPHPHERSHRVVSVKPGKEWTLNFCGGGLPRSDKGDRNEYCKFMMTLFVPWRSGGDLKAVSESWNEAFERCSVTIKPSDLQVINNFNLLYECRDARDEFHANRQAARNQYGEIIPQRSTGSVQSQQNIAAREVVDCDMGDDNTVQIPPGIDVVGRKTATRNAKMLEMREILRLKGWGLPAELPRAVRSDVAIVLPHEFVNGNFMSVAHWRNVLTAERSNVLATRQTSTSAKSTTSIGGVSEYNLTGTVRVMAEEELNIRVESGNHGVVRREEDLREHIVGMFNLNNEQARAFRIICAKLMGLRSEPLLMYLGGMAGTGKSQVLHACIAFLRDRNELRRFLMMAPTGSAAANVDGSTYHSVLGLTQANDDPDAMTLSSLSKIR